VITDLRELLDREKRRPILNHLFDSPAWWLACDVKARQRSLFEGRIVSAEFLGNCKTTFDDLGGILSIDTYGTDRFLVRQISEILNRRDCRDAPSRESLDWLQRALARGQISPKITFDGVRDVITDGNKTSAAFYELHKDVDPIELDVYLSR
jgi:hypothetical protein